METVKLAKPAITNLLAFGLPREKREKYAALLEKHEKFIASTGKLPPEILSEAERDFRTRRRRNLMVGFIVGDLSGGVLGGAVGIAAVEAIHAARKAFVAIERRREEKRFQGLSSEGVFNRNLALIRQKVRQLKGLKPEPQPHSFSRFASAPVT